MLNQQARDLTSYVSAYAPLMGVLATIAVALMQYYLQRQKAKQDLFEKRFDIFTVLKGYLSAVTTQDNEYKNEHFQRFSLATSQAQFLFGPEVLRFIDDFRALDVEREYGERDESEATLELVRRWSDEIEEVFRPYLQIHQEKSWLARFAARVNRWVEEAPDRTTVRTEA
jgi:hypothetical protein